MTMNNFGAEGYKQLADAVTSNETLLECQLSDSLLAGKESVKRINAKCAANKDPELVQSRAAAPEGELTHSATTTGSATIDPSGGNVAEESEAAPEACSTTVPEAVGGGTGE